MQYPVKKIFFSTLLSVKLLGKDICHASNKWATTYQIKSSSVESLTMAQKIIQCLSDNLIRIYHNPKLRLVHKH